MTNQEAIDRLRESICFYDTECPKDKVNRFKWEQMQKLKEVYQLAVVALEKQEPMECQNEERTTVKAFDGEERVVRTYKAVPCPSCGKWISTHGAQKSYCQFCGQALKFAEDTE